MTRMTAIIAAAALTTALSAPAYAGCFGKHAAKDLTMAETVKPKVEEQAMTTFEPTDRRAFEEAAKADERADDKIVPAD